MENKFIPLSVPNLQGNELKYVTKAIETEWVSTSGPYINEFESKIAEYVGSKGAVACQNGTSGLHLALILAGITNGDEVIVPALTFIAAVNPVKYLGAEPIFMDCDDSLTIDPLKFEEFIKTKCEHRDGYLFNKISGKKIKAMIVVHVFGNMCDMEAIMKIATDYSIAVIEDATEALGTYYTTGKYKGSYAGTIGLIGVYSFNGNKIITTGGGGMLVSNDETILKKAKHLSTQAKSDEKYYYHDQVGYNYRMTNLQAALGIAQIEQLELFIENKKLNYEMYKSAIDKINGLHILPFREGIRPNYWFYSLYCDETFKLDRDQLIKYLESENIQTRPIWGLINEQKPYLESQNFKIDSAKKIIRHIINIPCSSNLTKADVNRVINTIRNA